MNIDSLRAAYSVFRAFVVGGKPLAPESRNRSSILGQSLRTSLTCSLSFFLAVTQAQAASFDFVSEAPLYAADEISFSTAGITLSARAYHVEFANGTSTIYGPFSTGNVGSRQVFGPCARGVCDTGLGLRSQQALGQSDTDMPSGGLQPGFDNITAAGSLPSIQFALFRFDAPVAVTQITVDDTSNFGRAIWAAGGTVAPSLGNSLLAAFAGYTVVNSDDGAGDGVFVHSISGLTGITYLAVGTPLPTSVGTLGPIAAIGSEQFYINGLTVTAVPEPSTIVFFVIGLGMLTVLCRTRRRRRSSSRSDDEPYVRERYLSYRSKTFQRGDSTNRIASDLASETQRAIDDSCVRLRPRSLSCFTPSKSDSGSGKLADEQRDFAPIL